MMSHSHHKYEELMVHRFCDDMRCFSMMHVFLSSSGFQNTWGLPPMIYDELGIFVIDVVCSMTKFQTSWKLLFLLVIGHGLLWAWRWRVARAPPWCVKLSEAARAPQRSVARSFLYFFWIFDGLQIWCTTMLDKLVELCLRLFGCERLLHKS